MKTHTFTFVLRIAKLTGLGALCITGAFLFGIHSAGELEPGLSDSANALEASLLPVDTAVEPQGHGTLQRAVRILEIANGDSPTASESERLDIDHDGRITSRDALLLLQPLSH